MPHSDEYWMAQALALAKQGAQSGEVPVGAVLVKADEAIGEGWNRPIGLHDASAHAEIVALRAAGEQLNNYRLTDTTFYVTLEPCLMCVGAMIHARVTRLVYGATDPKGGAVISLMRGFEIEGLNHCVEAVGGVMAEACGELLKEFFQARR